MQRRQKPQPHVNGVARPAETVPGMALPGDAGAGVSAEADAATVPAVDPYRTEDPHLTSGIIIAEPPPVEYFLGAPWTGPPPLQSSVDAAAVGPAVDVTAAAASSSDGFAGDGRSRGFARAGVWAIPAAVVALGVTSFWGAPSPDHPPAGVSPGSWLVLTSMGLALGLLGAVSLTTLLLATPGRLWAFAGMLSTVAGTVLAAPALGVIALARPAVGRLGDGPRSAFEADLASGPVFRGLSVGGLVLLAIGWILIGYAVVGSRLLNRVDGYLVVAAVVLAAAAIFARPLLTIASLSMLAAGLGIGWTANRAATDTG
jgi:hypothetical protein